MDYLTIKLISALVPALVLIALDLWLRSRQVSDPVAVWLYCGFLSWALVAAISMVWGKEVEDRVAYLLSPVSSVLFAIAGFQLSRVREALSRARNQGVKYVAIGAVGVLSLASLVINLIGHLDTAMEVDAVASILAVLFLGLGVVYSFWKYNNLPLAALAVPVFIAIIWRQVDSTWLGVPQEGYRLVMTVASNLAMGTLLVAVAMAWGLSEASRLTIVGSPTQVDVSVLIFDLRGSSEWAEKVRSNTLVSEFMNALRDWALRISRERMQTYESPTLIKFLGDGYLLVWEAEPTWVRKQHAMQAACSIYEEYPAWRDHLLKKGECPAPLPLGIGVGLDFGIALRLTHENGSYDYIGRCINQVAKFEDRARPDGGVAISEDVWETIQDTNLKERFRHRDEARIGSRDKTPVRVFKKEGGLSQS